MLPTVTNAALDMGVQIPLQNPAFISSAYIPQNGNAGSYTLFLREAFSLGVEMTPSERQYQV